MVPGNRACVVGSKRDTIPYDYSMGDLNARGNATNINHCYGVDYFLSIVQPDRGSMAYVNTLVCRSILFCLTLPDVISTVDAVTGTKRTAERSTAPSSSFMFHQLAAHFLNFVAATFSLPVPTNVNQDVRPDFLLFVESANNNFSLVPRFGRPRR